MKNIVLILFCFSFLFSCASIPDSDSSLMGSDYKKKDRDFFYAVKNNDDLDNVQKTIRKADVNVSDRLGQTALMWACWNGNLPVIREILSRPKVKTSKRSRSDSEIELQYNSLFAFVMSPNLISAYGYEPEKKNIITNDKEPREIEYMDYYSLINDLEKEDLNTTLSPNKILYQLIIKDPNILDDKDSFGDTVIHKIIRSNNIGCFYTIMAALCRNEYKQMQDLITKKRLTESAFIDLQAKIKEKELSLLDNKNKNNETPLLLAVRRQRGQMIALLINKGVSLDDDFIFGEKRSINRNSLLIESFDNGNGDYDVFDEILVGKGNRSIVSRLNDIPYNGTDEYFESYIKDFQMKSKDEYAQEKASNYLIKYQEKYLSALKGNDELTVELLRDGKYDDVKRNLISLLKKETVSPNDIAEIYNILNNNKSFISLKEDKTNKGILQLAIENESFEVFNTVFDWINPKLLDRLDPVGNSFGDYLIVAIVNDKKNVIEYLLKSKVVTNQFLMNCFSRYDMEDFIINGSPIFDPLSIYLSKFSEETINSLDKSVIDFYINKFSNNPEYCSSMLNLYINNNISENVFDYIFNRFPNLFFDITDVNKQPIVRVLSESTNIESNKRKIKLLAKYLEQEAINKSNVNERQKSYDLIKTNLENRTGEIGVKEILDLIQGKEALSIFPGGRR